MSTADEREQACDWFDQMPGVGYIVTHIIDGERVCYLHNGDGDTLVGSRYGMVPLINYARDREIIVLTRH
ncbi:hypothetical protein G6L12_05785 [Agrobacterium rhizogenes]|nr:hypothetical protein [Rhizobium rhizogenes]NTF73985.1 hypothetical protein [Rhizobium rhizogenes]